jgi:hypothetical protein
LVGASSARDVAESFQTTVPNQVYGEMPEAGLTAFTGVLNRNDTNGPRIVLGKSRGTTVGSSTIVQNNDQLGLIRFGGADGVDLVTPAAEIVCEVDGTPGANDMPGRLVFVTTADGAASPTERMRITSSGNVGIGATTLGARLTVAQSAGFLVELQNTGAAADNRKWDIGLDATSMDIVCLTDAGAAGGNFFKFNRSAEQLQSFQGFASAVAWFHVDNSTQRVGIGTASPSSLLHLADAGDITVGTTTGTKIGTATTQKLGFYNATPVVQPTAVADATTALDVITQLNDLLAKLRTLGIIAT